MEYNVLILLFKLLIVTVVYGSKLNVPRVLLPVFNDFSSKFVLEATEGSCYKWSTTRLDVITLQPLNIDPDHDCSAKAIVTTITKEKARNIAVVLAEDAHTRQVLRCDVIVDVIESLGIVTTTREVFMEEAPEAFEVRAYDAQGNEFSTLEGVEFDWCINSFSSKKNMVMVRFIPFKDSPYETPSTVATIEENNKRGHIVLLEGIKTGSAKITVKLPQEEYRHIKPCEVQLSIIANLIIYPSDAYIMTGDTIKFNIIHMNNGMLETVKLPHFQFYLDVEDNVIASADKNSGEITGLKDGKTRVVLHDHNVDESDVGLKLPSATINVVTPAYMILTILPHRNWAVMLSEQHDIVAEVYSSNDHKLHLGSGVQIRTEVGEHFEVEQRSQNGSWLMGWTVKEGTTNVKAELESVIHSKLGIFKIQPPLIATAELFIFPRITVIPNEVILPWDPQLKPKYDVSLEAKGGDERFLWTSSNHSLGVVTQMGIVKTHSYGYFEVSASMMKNHHNRENAEIHILPPSHLEIVEFVMESEVGSIIYLHVALYAEKFNKKTRKSVQVPFSNCQNLPFKVKLSDANFYYNKSAFINPVTNACTSIGIVGLNVGTSKVLISYYTEGKILEDSVTVSTYKPLQLLHPRNVEILLAVGTSTHLIFTGGPKSIIGRSSLYNRIVTSASSSTVKVKDITETLDNCIKQDFIVLDALCLKLGESWVTLAVSSNPSVPKCKNQETSILVRVICGKPRSISLQPSIKVANVESCPMDLSADRVVVQSYKDIELDVAVTDERGRRFLNVSSLKFDWSLKPKGLGEIGISDGVFTKSVTDGPFIYANKSYQLVKPKSQTGVMEILVSIIGYKKEKLRMYRIIPEWPEFLSEYEKDEKLLPISSGIHLYLVGDTMVAPNVTSMYNHPGNKKIITVDQGSGYYDIALSDASIAHVKYLDRKIEIIPMNDGEVKINLIDLCLVSPPAVVVIRVVSVHTIKLEMADKVEIGRCIPCIARLYDEDNNLLEIPDVNMIDLVSTIDVDIVKIEKVKEDARNPWPLGEIHYVVTGKSLGETKLSFSVGETTSTATDLQVFPPLKVFPRNATLLLGSTLQFSSTGGPQPDCNVEYEAVINTVANINVGGLAEGLTLGHTRVIARATGINPITGLRVIYGEDTTDLGIISLTGIKISIPLSRIRVGATVPAWATPTPKVLSPLVLGSVCPSVKFEWTVDDPEIVNVYGSFTQYGIEYNAEDDLSVHITGLKAGKTTLHLDTIVPGIVVNRSDHLHAVFSTSIDIEIFESLLVTYPRVSGETILMSPQSTLQLETNMDGITKVYFSLTDSDPPTTGVRSLEKSMSIANPIVTVSESGLLQSYNAHGRAMIFVFSSDEHGLKQTISFIVEVKPIHYMVLNVFANWRIGEPALIKVIPLGTEIELKATYHDNTGAQFVIGNKELKLRSNRFDLIRVRPGIDNSSVIISFKKPGNTVLKVWADGYQKTVEYVKFHVDSVFSPIIDHVTTGDIICMWTPLITASGVKGGWSSSEHNLINVDTNTGISTIVSARGGQVGVSHTLHPSASLQLQVVPPSQIVMLPMQDAVLTNSLDSGVYRIPLVLASRESNQKTKNLFNGKHCQEELKCAILYYPFSCHAVFTNNTEGLGVEEIFEIKPDFDIERGQYTCDLSSKAEANFNTSTINSNISIWSRIEGSSIESAPVQIHFIPAIYAEKELVLSEPSYSGNLYISGLDYVLDDVIVKPYDKNLLFVNLPEKPEQNLLSFRIKLLDYHWKLDELGDSMSLKVLSKLTNQLIKVHVKTSAAGQFKGPLCPVSNHSPLVSFLYNYWYNIAILVSIFVVFIITFCLLSAYFNPKINPNVTRSLFSAGISQNNATPQYQRRSPCGSPINRNIPYNPEPVYGDPSNFYSTSAESRRNRRIM